MKLVDCGITPTMYIDEATGKRIGAGFSQCDQTELDADGTSIKWGDLSHWIHREASTSDCRLADSKAHSHVDVVVDRYKEGLCSEALEAFKAQVPDSELLSTANDGLLGVFREALYDEVGENGYLDWLGPEQEAIPDVEPGLVVDRDGSCSGDSDCERKCY